MVEWSGWVGGKDGSCVAVVVSSIASSEAAAVLISHRKHLVVLLTPFLPSFLPSFPASAMITTCMSNRRRRRSPLPLRQQLPLLADPPLLPSRAPQPPSDPARPLLPRRRDSCSTSATELPRHSPHYRRHHRSSLPVSHLPTPPLPSQSHPHQGGHSATYWAAKGGHTACISLLLGAGADGGQTNAWGRTPLISAAAGGQAAACRQLLQAGADPNVRVPEGWTALYYAQHRGHTECEEVLRLHGAISTGRGTPK